MNIVDRKKLKNTLITQISSTVITSQTSWSDWLRMKGTAAQLRCERVVSDVQQSLRHSLTLWEVFTSSAAVWNHTRICMIHIHTQKHDDQFLKKLSFSIRVWEVCCHSESHQSRHRHLRGTVSSHPKSQIHIMSYWRQYYSYSYRRRRRKEMRVGSSDEIHCESCAA